MKISTYYGVYKAGKGINVNNVGNVDLLENLIPVTLVLDSAVVSDPSFLTIYNPILLTKVTNINFTICIILLYNKISG